MTSQTQNLTVIKFRRVFTTGSSTPALVSASDGQPYIVKFLGSGTGPPGLTAEYIVNQLAAFWKFPVPTAKIIEIVDKSPVGVGTDEFWDLIGRSTGPNLAIEYIVDTKPLVDLTVLEHNERAKAQLHFIDSVFANFDRTADNPNLLVDRLNTVSFIDHDTCRFLFNAPVGLSKGHILEKKTVDRARLGELAVPSYELCDFICRQIPLAWQTTPINAAQLHRTLQERMKAYEESA